jgi:hypothetical protein
MTTWRGALLSSLFLFAGTLGCGAASVGEPDDGGAGQGLDVWVEPPEVAVEATGSTQFAAAVTGTANLAVRWVVDEANGGSVDSTGLYRAPTQAGVYHVRAVLVANDSISSTAQVTVTSTGGGGGGGGGPLAACATAPLRTTGPVYYYCDCQSGASAGCTPGDDAAAGTSPSAPRRTLANAVTRFNSMAAGSTVALCRGGSFTRTATAGIYNAACRAGSTCDFRDYAPAGMESAPRPVIQAGGSDMFRAQTGGHDEGYRFWNLDIRHTGGTGISFWFSSDVTDVDVCNVAGTGGDAAGVINPWVARLTIRGSQWTNYANQGFIGGAEDLTIDGNYFSNVGAMRGAQYHSIYLGGGGDAASTPGGWPNERVTNNEIRLSSCQGAPIVVHGRHVNPVIENNLVVATSAAGGCYGIALSHGGYPYSTWVRNASIRRNRIVLNGGGEGISLGVCGNCVVTDNSIALTAASSGHRAIAAPDAAARTGTYPDEQVNTGTIIQNNSIYLASSGYGVTAAIEGSNYVIENNAVWTTGPSCLNVTRPALRNSNNYCRPSTGGPTLGSIWVNAQAGDLRLPAGSPLIGYGSSSWFSSTALSPTWSSTDRGVARTPPIDAGAHTR